MKIVTVCGTGVGTAVLLKMNADRALERLGVFGTVEATDLATAKGAALGADLVLTNADTAPLVAEPRSRVRVIDDFMDLDEIAAVIRDSLNP